MQSVAFLKKSFNFEKKKWNKTYKKEKYTLNPFKNS